MLKSKDLKLYLLISLLGLGIMGSDIALITKNKTLQNSVSTISNLQEQNSTLQAKLNDFELAYSQLETEDKQLQSEMDDFMQLQTSDYKDLKSAVQFKEALAQKEKEYNKLKEEYTMLSESYNDLLQEGLATSEQPEEETRRQRFTPEQIEQVRTSIRERTYEVLDSRMAEAKTEQERGILDQIRQTHDNIFDIQEQLSNAEGEERNRLGQAMGEEWDALSQLYQEYKSYQWKTLAEEYGVSNTDEFVKRAQSINQSNMPFGMGFGGGGRGGRPQGAWQGRQ